MLNQSIILAVIVLWMKKCCSLPKLYNRNIKIRSVQSSFTNNPVTAFFVIYCQFIIYHPLVNFVDFLVNLRLQNIDIVIRNMYCRSESLAKSVLSKLDAWGRSLT